MAALTTKADLYDKTATNKVRIWKSLALASGDTLATGLKDVWGVQIQKPASFTSWSVSSGVVTFTLTGPVTGPVVIFGR